MSKSISTSAQYVIPDSKICCAKVRKLVFSAPNSCSLSWLVKGATQLRTCEKECNKLDLTAVQYF
jgi:hypothetical protein